MCGDVRLCGDVRQCAASSPGKTHPRDRTSPNSQEQFTLRKSVEALAQGFVPVNMITMGEHVVVMDEEGVLNR